MSKFIKILRSVIKKFDLFPTSQFLRYKQEADYKTATGGFISITVIIIFLILFYSLGIQTLNQKIIYGSTTQNIQVQPDSLKINFSNGSDFMFAFGINGVPLTNSSKKYFNITLQQKFYGPLQRTLINSTTVPLVPCTPEHFSYNSDTKALYNKFFLSQRLCPSKDFQFTVGGRPISQVYSLFSLNINYCNKTIDPSCVTETELLDLQKSRGVFNLYIPIINTIVNPGDSEYRQTYIEESNFFFFTTKMGLSINAQIQQYQIDTDVSLMPYADIVKQFITAIPEMFRVKQRPVFDNTYVELIFSKSSISTVYTRSFNKIDSYLSYVGGLVGTLLLFFFILGNYNQKSFIINIAAQLYKFGQTDQPTNQKPFNFVYYISMNVRQFFKCLFAKNSEGDTSKFVRVAKEMEKQLDIAYLLKRVSFCEQAVTSILDQHQIKEIYLKGKKSIKQAYLERKITEKQQKTVNKISKPFQLRHNESSIANILDFEAQQNKKQIQLQIITPKFKRDESSSQSENSQDRSPNPRQEYSAISKNIQMTQKQNSSDKLQNSNAIQLNIIKVINHSNEGNQINQKILKTVNKKIFPQNGLDDCHVNFQQRKLSQQGQVETKFQKQQFLQEHFDFGLNQ